MNQEIARRGWTRWLVLAVLLQSSLALTSCSPVRAEEDLGAAVDAAAPVDATTPADRVLVWQCWVFVPGWDFRVSCACPEDPHRDGLAPCEDDLDAGGR